MKDLYNECIKRGYRGTKEEFIKELTEYFENEELLELSPEELENLAGGAGQGNSKSKRAVAAMLAGLSLTGTGMPSGYAKETPDVVSSDKVVETKKSSLKNILWGTNKRKAITLVTAAGIPLTLLGIAGGAGGIAAFIRSITKKDKAENSTESEQENKFFIPEVGISSDDDKPYVYESEYNDPNPLPSWEAYKSIVKENPQHPLAYSKRYYFKNKIEGIKNKNSSLTNKLKGNYGQDEISVMLKNTYKSFESIYEKCSDKEVSALDLSNAIRTIRENDPILKEYVFSDNNEFTKNVCNSFINKEYIVDGIWYFEVLNELNGDVLSTEEKISLKKIVTKLNGSISINTVDCISRDHIPSWILHAAGKSDDLKNVDYFLDCVEDLVQNYPSAIDDDITEILEKLEWKISSFSNKRTEKCEEMLGNNANEYIDKVINKFDFVDENNVCRSQNYENANNGINFYRGANVTSWNQYFRVRALEEDCRNIPINEKSNKTKTNETERIRIFNGLKHDAEKGIEFCELRKERANRCLELLNNVLPKMRQLDLKNEQLRFIRDYLIKVMEHSEVLSNRMLKMYPKYKAMFEEYFEGINELEKNRSSMSIDEVFERHGVLYNRFSKLLHLANMEAGMFNPSAIYDCGGTIYFMQNKEWQKLDDEFEKFCYSYGYETKDTDGHSYTDDNLTYMENKFINDKKIKKEELDDLEKFRKNPKHSAYAEDVCAIVNAWSCFNGIREKVKDCVSELEPAIRSWGILPIENGAFVEIFTSEKQKEAQEFYLGYIEKLKKYDEELRKTETELENLAPRTRKLSIDTILKSSLNKLVEELKAVDKEGFNLPIPKGNYYSQMILKSLPNSAKFDPKNPVANGWIPLTADLKMPKVFENLDVRTQFSFHVFMKNKYNPFKMLVEILAKYSPQKLKEIFKNETLVATDGKNIYINANHFMRCNYSYSSTFSRCKFNRLKDYTQNDLIEAIKKL